MEILPLSPPHIPAAAQVLLDAFCTDPSVLAMYEGLKEAEQHRRLLIFFKALLASCIRRGWALEVRDQGQTVAVGTIYPPGTYPLPWLERVRLISEGFVSPGLFERDTWAVLRRVLSSFGEVEKEQPEQPHYYLEWIGVLPERQGQGLGTALVQTVLRRADQQGAGCFLETENPRNLPLYERLGFQVANRRVILGVQTWFLVREPITL